MMSKLILTQYIEPIDTLSSGGKRLFSSHEHLLKLGLVFLGNGLHGHHLVFATVGAFLDFFRHLLEEFWIFLYHVENLVLHLLRHALELF